MTTAEVGVVSASDPDVTPEPLPVLLRRLTTTPAGLDSREAGRRLAVYGANELPAERRTPVWRDLGRQLWHPLAVLLWLAAALSFATGTPVLGVAIVAVVLVNAAVAFVQERQASQAVAALRAYLPQRARVRRDGRIVAVDAVEIVPGDVLVLAAGDRVCADGRLVSGSLTVDLSPLTGEPVPVPRSAHLPPGASAAEVRDDVPSGVTCTRGEGEAVVVATGRRTRLGHVAVMTQQTRRVESPLERQVRRAAWLIAAVAVTAGLACVPLGLVAGLGPSGSVTFAIGLLVANVPEGLLPTITLALALGVRVLAASGALVTRLSAVETLGSTTAIATDKTGTLTDNRVAVARYWTPGADVVATTGLDGAPHLADAVAWGLPTDASDPVTEALRAAVTGRSAPPHRAEFAFEADRRRASVVVDAGSGPVVVTSGAPEGVLERCIQQRSAGGPVPLAPGARAAAQAALDQMTAGGLRVIAVATRAADDGPTDPDAAERLLCLEGLVGLLDPPRPGVRDAVASCHAAHVVVHVVTGDHERTAREVMRRVGLHPTRVVTGADLAGLSDDALDRLLARRREVLFARSSPADKLRVTEALQRLGEVVAVTGDGVNDAPALRRADIGVAMGRSGTDVARGAAAMILTDDDFSTVVRAIREGRRAFDNLRGFVTYILAHSVPEIVPFAVFALSGGAVPLPLTVLLVLAIDLGTETLPALALAREEAEPDVMTRPPRPRREPLITGRLLIRSWRSWVPCRPRPPWPCSSPC